jgi:hypothetical protein
MKKHFNTKSHFEQMMKIIFGNHKVIINNKHLVCFHEEKN